MVRLVCSLHLNQQGTLQSLRHNSFFTTLKCTNLHFCFCSFIKCLSLGCGRVLFLTNWYQSKQENGRVIRKHAQAHRLQLPSVEVEDEGHARGQRSLAAGTVRGQETGEGRCHDMGGDAHEDDDIHHMLHRHEHVQQLQ